MSLTGLVRRRTMFLTSYFRPGVFAGVLLCLVGVPAPAQQDEKRAMSQDQASYRPSGPSGLENENLAHVSASAGQIEEVLRKDPGLLVELKRWVAKEATDYGQVVEDSDLTDKAVFERLEHDVQLRSLATRLLQRYGYLLPSPNPNSEVAKEQELRWQERARRLVQIEAQEDAVALQEDGDVRRTASCDPRGEQDCALQSAQRPRHRTLAPGEMAKPPADSPAIPDLLRQPPITQTIQTVSISQGTGLADGSSLSAVQSPLPNSALTIPASVAEDTGGLASSAPRAEPVSRPRPTTGGSLLNEGGFSPVAMVHRANPYADIPSLYDMYVQAAAWQRPARRFGLEVFQNGTRESDAIPMDLPVGPDYVVGPGDGLAIDLWGGVSQRLVRMVDRSGRVSLPEVGPLLVSGHTLGQVQQAVQLALRSQFRDVSVDVSLSRLRTVRVYVVGDVAEPGAYDISSLSTPLNALFAAGGVTPRGSLRALKHYRGRELVEEADAYDLLLHGVQSDPKRLENGDTLMVSPIGSQVTVDGMVRRPAIYELRGERSLADVLELAGGILPTAALGHIEVQRVEAHQKRTMFTLNVSPAADAASITKQLGAYEVRDGDEVHIFPIAPYNEDAIYLQGHVLRPGRYSYRKDMKLTDLIASYSELLPEPASHYAEIVRLNPPDNHPSVESFDLSDALANPASAPKLQPLDTVRIFSRFDFEPAPTVWVGGEVRSPGRYSTSGQAHVRDAVYLAGGLSPDASMDSAQLFRTQPDGTLKILSVSLRDALGGNPADNLLLQPRDRIFIQRSPATVDPPTVYIRGEVARPGRYPLTAGMKVSDLVRSANGFLRSADSESGDLVHYLTSDQNPTDKTPAGRLTVNLSAGLAGAAEDPLLQDGDVLTVPQLGGWKDRGAAVTIRGEVRKPGEYGIQPGERLSSLLKRSGGLLSTAYPRAALFERIEVRELQQKSRQELIQRLERESTVVKTAVNTNGSDELATQQAALQQRDRMIDALNKAPISGRLVIHLRSDLKGFEGSPDDIELRAGDTLTIPKQPGAVMVVGQVYNSNAITYAPGKNAGWYVSRAGGATQLANKNAIFIVRSDGSVTSGRQGSVWSEGTLSSVIGPGDMIVVPEKTVIGSNTWKNIVAIAQIAQAGALAAAIAIP